jgi:hypothetical protein
MSLTSFFTGWRRGADAQVRGALKQLRPELERLEPAVVDWYVHGWPRDEQVVVYLACGREADRERLAARLPAIESRLRGTLLEREGAGAFAGPLTLLAASMEQVEREGGFFGYSHNH